MWIRAHKSSFLLVSPMIDQSRVDEIRRQIEAAHKEKQDELRFLTVTMGWADPVKIQAVLQEMRALNDELCNLLHVTIKPLEGDLLKVGQTYYVPIVRGQEELYFSAPNQDGAVEKINSIVIDLRETQVFVPVE